MHTSYLIRLIDGAKSHVGAVIIILYVSGYLCAYVWVFIECARLCIQALVHTYANIELMINWQIISHKPNDKGKLFINYAYHECLRYKYMWINAFQREKRNRIICKNAAVLATNKRLKIICVFVRVCVFNVSVL